MHAPNTFMMINTIVMTLQDASEYNYLALAGRYLYVSLLDISYF